ncbi:MAG: hypothetical protein Q4D30_06250 [Bacteroidales bacterium]|nr:hypothetical protein [Bacteroidales bacterium]
MPYRIICDDYCQLCNRFWSYIDSIGWAIKNNGHVYSLFWDKNIKDFDALRYNKYISFPSHDIYAFNKGIKFFGWNFTKFLYAKIVDSPFAHRLYESGKLQKFGFIEGWPTRYSTENIPDRKIVQQLFLPNKSILEKVDPLFEESRNNGYFIIGVHIRRGDYQTWLDGQYYYSFETYREFMKQVKQVYSDKKVCFFMASNEKIPMGLFNDLECFSIDNANAAHDLYALSLCDRLIGPPSTYSRWASFVSQIPLYFIFDPKEKIVSDSQFCPIADHFHFENGQEIPI